MLKLHMHVISSWLWLAITLLPQLAHSTSTSSQPPSITGWMEEMLERVNQERANNGGLDPLCYNEKVILAAQVHNQDMVDNNFFSHTGSDGFGMGRRLTNQGYIWNRAAENIANGQSSVTWVMNAWMNSPGHRANILSTHVVHFGAAWDAGTNKWTQVFGNSNSEGCLSTPQSPTTAPVASPSTTPVAGPSCNDKEGEWRIGGKGKNKNWCEWAGQRRTFQRCSAKKLTTVCPVTCSVDKRGRWKIDGQGEKKNWCKWAKNDNNTSQRCAQKKLTMCAATCSKC